MDLVGQIEADPCRPSGLARDSNGDLFITTAEGGGIIYRLTPNATNPTSGGALGSVYATGVPGANGVAFLGTDLFVTDGGQNMGRVWKIASCATLPCLAVEFFRIQPMRNSTALGGNVATQPDGVGSERYTVPRHTILSLTNQTVKVSLPTALPLVRIEDTSLFRTQPVEQSGELSLK